MGLAELRSTSWVLVVMGKMRVPARRAKGAITQYSKVQHRNYSGPRSQQMTRSEKAADQRDAELIIIMQMPTAIYSNQSSLFAEWKLGLVLIKIKSMYISKQISAVKQSSHDCYSLSSSALRGNHLCYCLITEMLTIN